MLLSREKKSCTMQKKKKSVKLCAVKTLVSCYQNVHGDVWKCGHKYELQAVNARVLDGICLSHSCVLFALSFQGMAIIVLFLNGLRVAWNANRSEMRVGIGVIVAGVSEALMAA